MDVNGSQSDAEQPRALPILRALIDAADHELLQLLAQRKALIAEVAQFKRERRVPIRDSQREREIIEDRRDRATPLGLSPNLIESLFRLIMWASRDHQAAMKAELPRDIESKSVAVIGGRGEMGRRMAELFGDLGHAVTVADLNTRLAPEEAAAAADVVVISVPIDRTIEVIRRLGPLVRKDALLMDVTSIKQAPVEVMLQSSKAAVVGTHPLFGPTVHSLQGQRVVLCPGRGEAWLDWLRSMFRARGLIITQATPPEHDLAMAIVQVLVHFATEVMGQTLVQLDVQFEKTLAFTSPVYLMELIMTARHFAQSSDLYASIQMSNSQTEQVTEAFVKASQQLREVLVTQDRNDFVTMFENVRDFFGSFADQAMEQSSFLIDRLVERT